MIFRPTTKGPLDEHFKQLWIEIIVKIDMAFKVSIDVIKPAWLLSIDS